MTIAWTKDTGIMAKMLNTIITANQEHSPISKLRGNQPLSLNHLSPIFLVYGLGIGISILAFFFENSFIRRPSNVKPQSGPLVRATDVMSTRL